MDCDPKRLLESSELSPAERSVLQAARTPPASYDVLRGLERFRAGLAAPVSPSAAGKLHPALGKFGKFGKFGRFGKFGKAAIGLGALAGVYFGAARDAAEVHPSVPLTAAEPVAPAAGSLAQVRSAAGASLRPAAAGASAIEPLPEHRPSSEPRHTTRMPRRLPQQSAAAAGPAPRAAAQPTLERGRNLQHAHAAERAGDAERVSHEPNVERPCEVDRSKGARAACEAKLERTRDAEGASAVAREPEVEHDDALNELRATARVRSLLRSDPRAALSLLDRLEQLHPHGYFLEERAALRVFALLAAGEHDDASARARAFVRAHPDSPFAAQVRKIGER